jgi:predicted Zn-dependent peptidase
VPPGASQEQIEGELESRLALLRDAPVPPEQIETAKNQVRQALVFDLQTTEDAAHQLAYFDGLGALPVLLGLADSVSRVTSADLMRVAAQYLDPSRRTLGWYRAGVAPKPGPQASLELDPVYGPAQAGRHGMAGEPTGEPQLHRLASGLPAILQRAAASPTVHLRMVFGSGSLWAPSGMSGDDPSPGYSSLNLPLARGELASGLEQILKDLEQVRNEPMVPETAISDPAARLERLFLRQSGWDQAGGSATPRPILVSLVGDIDPGEALALLQSRLGSVTTGQRPVHRAPREHSDPLEVLLDHPVAQEGLGYLVAAPGPRDPSSMAWRALLYILSHGYEGRLGKEAISRQGLVYYIDSTYRSDGEHGWISLATGVDPSKYDAMRTLLQKQLQQLQSEPPGSEEVAQARQHMAGRYQTAAQSNQERSGELAREWLWHGTLRSPEEVKESIASVSLQHVLDAVPGFLRGNIVSVRSPRDAKHAMAPQSEGPIGRDD